MPDRLKRALPALIGLALFAAALFVLRRELHAITWHELTVDVVRTPASRLALALLLTALNYAILTGYDFLAFAYIGKRLSWDRIALASFLAYAVANNVGFAMLSGTSVRYRFYARWGVTAPELSRLIVAYATTFWLGLLLLGGASLATSRLPDALGIPRALAVPAGILLVLTSLGYVALPLLRRAPILIRGVELPLPPPPIAAAQLLVSAIDWALAAAVLYVLLPPSGMPFRAVLGAFVVAQLFGLASHVPGGVGVFEGTMVLVTAPFIDSRDVLPALIVYRVVYYLVPLTIALMVLVADELHQRRAQAARMSARLGWLTDQITPAILAWFTFLSGVVLLFSGATPAAAGRLALLERVFPLGVIEASHFMSSVLGAALLLLSQGLARRLDAAFVLAATTMALGIGASLLKGVDYEEAAILAVVLVILWRARPAFDRRSAFFDTRFSIGWMLAVAAAVGASIGLGEFAYKHLDYSNQLWWQFELHGEAPRFMRGTVGAAVLLVLFVFARLIRPSPHEAAEPTDADLADAARVMAAQTATYPHLVYLATRRCSSTSRAVPSLMRRAGAHVGRARGSGRAAGPDRHADPHVPRAVRRLRRRASFLRGRQEPAAPLRGLRADVREAGRGSPRRSFGVLARGGTRGEAPAGHALSRESRRDLSHRRTRGGAGDHGPAARGVGRMAAGEIGAGEGVLARIFRSRVHRQMSGRRGREER